jgi:hypothetical protein
LREQRDFEIELKTHKCVCMTRNSFADGRQKQVVTLALATMLGPRTRSASQRAPRAEEDHRNVDVDGNERDPKRIKDGSLTPALGPSTAQSSEALANTFSHFRISVVTMTGAVIAIDDAAATDTILSVKERVFAANRKLFVRRQRLVYQPGPFGMDALADDETLGGAGVAQDGSAKLDVLLADLTAAEVAELGSQVSAALLLP